MKNTHYGTDTYHPFERVTAMVKAICEVLSISSEEHCESTVFHSGDIMSIIPKVYLGMG